MSEAKYNGIRMVATIHGFVHIGDLALWPKQIVTGRTRRQIMERVETVNAARAEVEKRAAALIAEFPGVTFGYLGNCCGTYDDRSYTIFLPHPGRIGTFDDRVGSYAPWEMDQMLAAWPRLEETVRTRMAQRQTKGDRP